MFGLFRIIIIAFAVWMQPTQRRKLKEWFVQYPEVMQLFRPPLVYGIVLGAVLLYVRGGFFLLMLGLAGTIRYLKNPQLKKNLQERIQLFDSFTKRTSKRKSAVVKDVTVSSSFTTTSQSSQQNKHSSSFTPSSLAMDFSWIKKLFYRLIATIIVIVVLSKGLPRYTVSPGEIALITRFGKLQDSYATEGLNFKVPLIDKVVRINIQTQKVEATANAASKDLQNISATIAVNGSVQAASAKELYRNLGDASLVAEKIINPSIQESVKAATAKYTAEELITKRTAVSQEIKVSLVEKLEKRGITVSDVNIVNFQFSADFDAAIEKKVKAEQEALAEKNKLESVKFQAQQKVEQAKAEAESIRIQAEAIKSQGGAEYVNLKWIEKWDGKLPQTSLGSSNGLILNLKQ